jgi:hypothetical protein|tara:strand:+ start:10717 stop:13221 length:2505 start_codon:yes stop_codon:yes gene_type:complete
MAENKTSGKLPFKEQCYLTWNIASFASQNEQSVYENLAIIEGNPTDVINQLVTLKKIAPRLLGLTPVENSALVPLIRLFKGQHGANKETAEIKFNTVMSKESIEGITQTRVGRGDGIGIKSVTYDLQGGSETGGTALVAGNVQDISITFVFQNLEMLVQREGNQPALIDLVSLPAGDTDQSPPTCAEGSPIDYSRLFDPSNFQIKLVYGYAVPQYTDQSIIDSELKEVIEKSRTTLILSLVKHEFDFKQDGTVELKCRYQAFSEGVMGGPKSDILFVGDRERDPNIDGKEKVAQNRSELIEQEKQRREQAGTQQGQEEIDARITGLEKERDKAQTDASDAREKQDKNDKVFVYKRLLEDIYNSGKVYFVDLTKEDVENHLKEISGEEVDQVPVPPAPVTGDYYEGTSEEQLDALRDGIDAGSGGSAFGFEFISLAERWERLTGQAGTHSSIPIDKDNPQKANPESLKKEGTVFLESDDLDGFTENLSEYSAANQSEKKVAGATRVNYIYYGDLLNIAFSVFNNNKDAKHVKPMLGPIEYANPKAKPGDGSQRTITNLADIPISLKKFVEWYNLQVVGQNRGSYLLEDFVKDTIKHLIHAALGENCFTDTAIPLPEPNISMVPLELAKTGGKSAVPVGQRVAGASIQVREGLQYKDVSKIDQYVYIYCYSFGSSQLSGQVESDAEKDIYHLHVGSNNGLVKKVTFSKIDDPSLDASRLLSQQCNLRHLRQNYKVGITMVGNSLFRPGQTFYLDPTLAGGTDPQVADRIATDLGLGGYYTVTKVGGEISRDGFSTEIEAIWESPRFSDRPATKPIKKLPLEPAVEESWENIDMSMM